MRMSRRQFNRGAMMLSGAAAMPPMPVSMKRGSDDAYEAIISEFVRAEETARATGLAQSGSGAMSATGKHLEGFISHLDMQVSPFESSAQVYRELRGFVKEQARKTPGKMAEKAERLIDQPDMIDTDESTTVLDEQADAVVLKSSDETV